MNKIALLMLCLMVVFSIANAKNMQTGTNKILLQSSQQGKPITPHRDVPPFAFTHPPTSLMANFYDYFIGNYDCLPMQVIPANVGGGYFLTYHGKRTPTGTRRVFYTHIDTAGNVINNNEVTAVTNGEGYASVAIDPVSGKPLYTWHGNVDADGEYEIMFSSDAFMAGISGLFNDVQIIYEAPCTVIPPNGTPTNDNEFNWPKAIIGPSPVANMRRVYIVATNYKSHSPGPSGNPKIVYADFNGDMLESAVPLTWSSTSIPTLDQWNHGPEWRRLFMDLAADNAGNLYYVGYHFATEADGTTSINEADIDVFMCPNYGQGTWTRVSDYSNIASWNPAGQPGGTGYFVDSAQEAYPDNELAWAIVNSGHKNVVIDNGGKVLMPALWSQTSIPESGYWDAFHTVKCLTFDPNTDAFNITEIYPQKNPDDSFNQCFTSWDVEAPWGEPEYSPNENNEMFLKPEVIYPFPHWDDTLHNDAMYLHYSHIKITEVNDENMIAAVWQDSQRARWANKYADTNYSAYSDTPEIYISVSADAGATWSEPIVLNNVDTPAMAGIKPMWVYPSNYVQYVNEVDGHKVGKLGLMFFDDNTWGSNASDPPAHPVNTGGRTMFAELQITFPIPVDNHDSITPAISRMLNPNFPNPFNPETTISFDMPKTGKARLDVFNVKGQLVKTLFDATANFGKTSLVWNGTDNSGSAVTSGVYFYRLATDNATETRKMMLMK